MPPYNVTVDFDDINKVATLLWKSSLTDIEGFRVCKDKKGLARCACDILIIMDFCKLETFLDTQKKEKG